MAKFQSPLLGYNNNVRHRGRLFHIQTEDSGVHHPHIITHLFMDGGRILKSVKKSYAEHVGTEGMSETVRLLMKEQHKAMFVALRDGQFDDLVEGTKKPSGSVIAAEPPPKQAVPSREAAPSSMEASTSREAPSKRPGPSPTVSPAPAKPPKADEAAAMASGHGSFGSRRDGGPPELAAALHRQRPATFGPPPRSTELDAPKATREPERGPSAAELTLDFDALERDAQAGGLSPYFLKSDLPPPPRNLFAKEPGTGAYRAVDVNAHRAMPPPGISGPTPPSSQRRPAAPDPAAHAQRPSTPPQKPPTETRHATSRPTASFGSPDLSPASTSMFSDELLTDKSLDEVILSYLAEDLGPSRRK